MDECKDCEYRGYSPEVCRLHLRHCQKHQDRERKPLPAPVKIGAKTLAGAGVGVATVFLGVTAASLVGGAALLHLALLKLGVGAGLLGGGIGFYKGLAHKDREPRKSER